MQGATQGINEETITILKVLFWIFMILFWVKRI